MDFKLETRNEFVFDERGNTVLTLRDESWNDKDFKLSLRKCHTDKEGNLTPNKGFSFLTEEGPNLLTEELVRRGYGNTKELVNLLKERDDISKEDLDGLDTDGDEEYYNPEDIFGVGVSSDD